MNRVLYWITRNRRFLDLETVEKTGVEMVLPLWAVLFLGVLAIVAAIWLYRRAHEISRAQRTTLTALRAGAYLALLWIVLTPRLTVEGRGRPAGPLPVVVDRTESMSIQDVGGTNRLAAALAVDAALAARAPEAPGLAQHPYLYGRDVAAWDRRADPMGGSGGSSADASESAPPAAVQPSGRRTSLAHLMEFGVRAHRGAYVPALLVIGDGVHNTPDAIESAVDRLKKERIPVYFVPTGEERPRDIALDRIVGEDIVFAAETFKFFAAARQSGFAGQSLPVIVRFGETEIAVDNPTPDRDGEFTIPLEHTPLEPGVYDLTVEIPAQPGEIVTDNNRVLRRVRVIKERIRVLVVFGEPSWEYRYLMGAFDKDRRVKASVFLQAVDPRVFDSEQERFIRDLPERPEDLFAAYNMVVIGRIDLRTLPKGFVTALGDFVAREGAGLALISDDRHMPYSLKGTNMEDWLPVSFEDVVGPGSFRQEMSDSLRTPYRLRIAEAGRGSRFVSFDPDPERNAEIWARFPEMYEVCPRGEPKPGAILLVEAVNANANDVRPAIAYHYFGRGIVLYMGFDSTWRWRREHGDRYFRDFWGKAVQFLGLPHMLGGQARSHLFLDRAECGVGDRVTVTAQVRNSDYSPFVAGAVTVTMTQSDGDVVRLELPGVASQPGLFRTALYPDREGALTFSLDSAFMAEEQTLRVENVNLEFKDAGVRGDRMRAIARETGGWVFDATGFADTNAPAAEPDAASADRAKRLGELARAAAGRGRHPLMDTEFVDALAAHVLQTISARRIVTGIREEQTVWDTPGTLLWAMLLFGVEYALRKRWYLD